MNTPLLLSRSTNFAPGVHIECFNGSNQTITTIDLVRFFLKNQNAYSKDNSFYIIDLTQVVNQYYKWLKYMPRVIPYYAVKCNPDPIIIRLLYLLG